MKHTVNFFFFVSLYVVHCERVAPGVSPQHYQNTQHHQYQQPQYHQQQPQYHQQQPQYQQASAQQVPVQQIRTQQVPAQQVPVQQVQQQAPQQQGHQQAPQQQGHHHGHGGHNGQVLNTANIVQEKEHIAEHLDVPIDTSKMTEQELQFHYFKMHDADNNNKLDGSELIKSLIHWHEQGSKERADQNQVEDKIFKDEELVTLIDPILNTDDTNRDGYIDYPEFIRAQQKAAASAPPKP